MARGNGSALTADARHYVEVLNNPRSSGRNCRRAVGALNKMGITSLVSLPPNVTYNKSGRLQYAETPKTNKPDFTNEALSIPSEGIVKANPVRYIMFPGCEETYERQAGKFGRATSPAQRASELISNTGIARAVLQRTVYARSKPECLETANTGLAIPSVGRLIIDASNGFRQLEVSTDGFTVGVLPEQSAIVIGQIVGRYGRVLMLGRNGGNLGVTQTLELSSYHWLDAPDIADIVDAPVPDDAGNYRLTNEMAAEVVGLVPDFVAEGRGFAGSTLTLGQDVCLS